MKRIALLLTVLVTLTAVALVFARDKSTMELKTGDEVYACNCGEKCPCKTMSMNEGKCTCGKDMVKAKVTKVEGGTAMLKAAGWEKDRPYAMTGKYMCNCGPDCKCDTISQEAGKCTCGRR
jgi:hypothetical protein